MIVMIKCAKGYCSHQVDASLNQRDQAEIFRFPPIAQFETVPDFFYLAASQDVSGAS